MAEWPKLLRDMPTDFAVRTRMRLQSGRLVIPAGTVGTIYQAANWSKLYFKADACSHCGVAVLAVGMRDQFEPIGAHAR